MRGFVTVKLLMYQTDNRRNNVQAKVYEYGYSEIMEINNAMQEEMAFKRAVSNAGQKYAYHTQQKYEDVEYNYDLLETWVTYVMKDKRGKRWLSKNPSELSPSTKRKLHNEIKSENKELRDSKKIHTAKDRDKMYAKSNKSSLTEQKRQFQKENKKKERVRTYNKKK